MTSIIPSIIYETIYQNIFQAFWREILTIMKVLAKTTRGPVHLQLFRPSVIRGPCLFIALLTRPKKGLRLRQGPSHCHQWVRKLSTSSWKLWYTEILVPVFLFIRYMCSWKAGPWPSWSSLPSRRKKIAFNHDLSTIKNLYIKYIKEKKKRFFTKYLITFLDLWS